jgi:hypothetical protein
MPMSRLAAALLPLTLLTATLGCHHTAGVCDCDNGNGACCSTLPAPGPIVVGSTPARAAEPIKEMPQPK